MSLFVHRVWNRIAQTIAPPDPRRVDGRDPQPTPRLLRCVAGWIAAAALFALCNALHLTNPGYFSHDELQWGAAGSAAAMPWIDWIDVGAFQYRPLTFNLWLLLSRSLFAHPEWFHAAWLALAFGLCAALFAALRMARVAMPTAAAATAAFALNPFAMYVHGWVATLGDLLWTGATIGVAMAVLRSPAGAFARPAFASAAFTMLALLSKEAALAIAPLASLCWVMSGRERRWAGAFAGSALPAAIYLALRWPALVGAPDTEGAYAWAALNAPINWSRMQVYAFIPTAFEISSLAHTSAARLWLSALMGALLLVAVLLAGRRVATFYLLCGAAALGPSLLLRVGAPQYGYGFSAVVCAALAFAWPRTTSAGRAIIAMAALLSCLHGFNVQREMRRAGEIEAMFSPSLRHLLDERGGQPIVLRPERASDAWIYRRLTTSLPGAAQPIVVLDSPMHEQAADAATISANGAIGPRR